MTDGVGADIPARVDVVVLGAGVVGAASARQLADLGARVLLVDRDHPPGAGSRAAAGVGVPSVRLLSDPELLSFAQAGQRVLAADLDRLRRDDGPALAVRPGLLRPVPTAEDAERLTALAAGHPDFLGRWLPADRLGELEPGWRGRAHGAFHDPGARVVNAAAYVDALVAEARSRGVLVRTGTAVRDVRPEVGAVHLDLDGPYVQTDHVVIACGAWITRIPGCSRLPVRPVRGQMVRLRTAAHDSTRPRHIVSGSLYVAPAPDGTDVLVGATEEDVGLAEGPTAEGVLLLLGQVARSWPGLRVARLVSAWSGFRAATPDGRPLIGELPGQPRLIVAGGHGGQGILTGAHTATLVAALIDGRRPDLTGFAPDRTLAGAR